MRYADRELEEGLEVYLATEGAVTPLPTVWTAELVGLRMIEAFDVLRRLPMRDMSDGTVWPAVLTEFSDLIDEESREDAESRFRRIRALPTRAEVTRMEEALDWPVKYLAHSPRLADGLTLWAAYEAGCVQVTDVIRERAQKATAVAQERQRTQNSMRDSARRDLAAQVASWANERLYRCGSDDDAITRIRHNAHIRFERGSVDLMPVFVRPADMMPDKVLSNASMHRNRYRATQKICAGLIDNEVPLR